jgi:hypothetical protein
VQDLIAPNHGLLMQHSTVRVEALTTARTVQYEMHKNVERQKGTFYCQCESSSVQQMNVQEQQLPQDRPVPSAVHNGVMWCSS